MSNAGWLLSKKENHPIVHFLQDEAICIYKAKTCVYSKIYTIAPCI